MNSIPDDVRQFIFDHVDSVAQLEVLFLMRLSPEQTFSALDIAKELRTSSDSVTEKIAILKSIGLLSEDEETPGQFRYHPKTKELADLVTRLEDVYKVRQHKVLELIFSSAKKARQFAKAFTISKNPNEDGDNG